MSTMGEHSIPMGTFSLVVGINVGDRGSSEKDLEAFRRKAKGAERELRPLAAGLTKLVDLYLHGEHPYRYLRDRIAPTAPTPSSDFFLSDERRKTVSIPLHFGRLTSWLGMGMPLPPNEFRLTFPTQEELPDWAQDKISANFCLSHLGPGGYLREWRQDPDVDQAFWPNRLPFCLQLGWGATRDPRLKDQSALDALLRSVFEGRRLPDAVEKEFNAAREPKEAWAFATTVWMFARDEDLGPWKAHCIAQAHRNFPEGSSVPEWIFGS
jgi:hypothetical protein